MVISAGGEREIGTRQAREWGTPHFGKDTPFPLRHSLRRLSAPRRGPSRRHSPPPPRRRAARRQFRTCVSFSQTFNQLVPAPAALRRDKLVAEPRPAIAGSGWSAKRSELSPVASPGEDRTGCRRCFHRTTLRLGAPSARFDTEGPPLSAAAIKLRVHLVQVVGRVRRQRQRRRRAFRTGTPTVVLAMHRV
jgi:hypothetical protein